MKTETKQKKGNNASNPQVHEIELSKIVVGNNPRKYFDQQELEELAENIAQVGVIQHITVRPCGDKKYAIVCGERRYRASILAKQKTIPAVIRELTDDEAMFVACSENMFRNDMKPVEEAEAIKYFIDSGKEDFKSLSKKFGKSEVYLRNRYALTNLIDEIGILLDTGEIQIGMGLLIASFEKEVQKNIFESHLKDDASSSWRYFSYTKFSKAIENNYSMNLSSAIFDTTACQICPFNSSLGQLFGIDNPRCQKASCFMEKKEQHIKHGIISMLELRPNSPIFHWAENLPDWLTEYIESNNREIIEDHNYSLYPEVPEMPTAEDCTYDGLLDEEEFSEAQIDYDNEMVNYNRELEEIKNSLENGYLMSCYVFEDNELFNAVFPTEYYLSLKEPETSQEENEIQEQEQEEQEQDIETTEKGSNQSTDQDSQLPPKPHKKSFKEEKEAIEQLQKQDKRNFEISIENSVRDVILLFPEKKIEGLPLEDFESTFYFAFLANKLEACKNKYFKDKKSYSVSLEDWFNLVDNFTVEDKNFIMREFIKENLKQYSYGVKSFTTPLLMQFASFHYPVETQQITEKYDKIYETRKAKIDNQIKDLQKMMEE